MSTREEINHLSMTKTELEQHRADARKTMKELETMKCNVEGSVYTWDQIVEARQVAVNEFLTWLDTGKTKHIHVSTEDQEILYEHFK